MKTFISWLIANFEIIVTFILCTVFGVLFFTELDGAAYTTWQKLGLVGVAICFVAMPASQTVRNFTLSCIMFAAMVAGYVYLIVNLGEIQGEGSNPISDVVYMLLISGGISFVIAAVVGCYTAFNMDDVVSRRMLYVNSDVSMFDITVKYSLNRFMAVFVYLTWAAVWTAGYILAKQIFQ